MVEAVLALLTLTYRLEQDVSIFFFLK